MLLAKRVVRWVTNSSSLADDETRARDLAEGRSSHKAFERLPQDVMLGYWLRKHPGARRSRHAAMQPPCNRRAATVQPATARAGRLLAGTPRALAEPPVPPARPQRCATCASRSPPRGAKR